MGNPTQLERYKKLLSFIDENFKEDINIEKVEAVCHYSYRNINRIFEALHQETIGKYIKRLRLEKAAQYLKYSESEVTEIAYEVGFKDRAAFSKAFKNKYGCSPTDYRAGSESIRTTIQQSLLTEEGRDREKLQFKIEFLPDFTSIFLEYRGSHQNIPEIESAWKQLADYADRSAILPSEPIFMTEIIDDTELDDQINSRFNLSLITDLPLDFQPGGLYRIKEHRRQKYVRFEHKGSPESCINFYKEIYAFWITDVALEFEDLPILEFYPNFEERLPQHEMITEIYIAVK